MLCLAPQYYFWWGQGTRSQHVGPGICVPTTPCFLRAETVGLHPWALLSQHFGCCLGWGQERGLSSLTLSLYSSLLLASLGLCYIWPHGEQHRGDCRSLWKAQAGASSLCCLDCSVCAGTQGLSRTSVLRWNPE